MNTDEHGFLKGGYGALVNRDGRQNSRRFLSLRLCASAPSAIIQRFLHAWRRHYCPIRVHLWLLDFAMSMT